MQKTITKYYCDVCQKEVDNETDLKTEIVYADKYDDADGRKISDSTIYVDMCPECSKRYRERAKEIIFAIDYSDVPGNHNNKIMWRDEKSEEEKLLAKLDEDKSQWKHPWMKKICRLALEYMSLAGLEDALRASEIPGEITDIVNKENADKKERRQAEADETLYSGGGCEDCPFGNGEGGCEAPDCQFEGPERIPTAREWVNDPSYVGD